MSLKACDSKRLLIAEDESAARTLYAVILGDSLPDLRVDQVANGSEAVKQFEQAHHGVILMDLHMPVMDGLEAFKRISECCANNGWASPCVIFCTAYAPPETLAAIVGNDKPHTLLIKPMGVDALVAAVQQKLEILKQPNA